SPSGVRDDDQFAPLPFDQRRGGPGAPASFGVATESRSADRAASQALEDVVNRFDAFVRRSTRRHGLHGADVDEVVQDLRLRMWRSLGTAKLIRRAKASYIYRVAIS